MPLYFSQIIMDTIKNPVDSIFPFVFAAMNNWLQTNTEEKIKKEVEATLNKNKEEIILKLLGFDKRWGKDDFELDHCNGRAGNSAAGDFIRNVQAEAIKQWLSIVKMPPIPKTTEAQIKKEMLSRYKEAMIKQIDKLVQEQAVKDAQELYARVYSTEYQSNFFKSIELIAPTKS